MDLPTHHLLLGLTLGALAATGLAATGAGFVAPSFGDEPAATAFDASKLMKFPDYSVQVDASVATDPVKTNRIKKIEFGNVSYVDIVTTATGTYSTDGIASPNVSYPGIDEQAGVPRDSVGVWNTGHRWQVLPRHGSSFIYQRTGRNSIFSHNGQSCVITPNIISC